MADYLRQTELALTKEEHDRLVEGLGHPVTWPPERMHRTSRTVLTQRARPDLGIGLIHPLPAT